MHTCVEIWVHGLTDNGKFDRPPSSRSEAHAPYGFAVRELQGSNWLLAVGAEKRGRDSKRISSSGCGGRFRPQMGSKGIVLGGGARGQSPGSSGNFGI